MGTSLLISPSTARARRFTGLSRSRRKLTVAPSLALLLWATTSARAQVSSGCIGYCGNGIAIGIGAIAGGAAAIGIFLAVNHDRHLLQGCVSNGSDGPQLQTTDAKIFALQGDPAVIKIGDRVKFHGNRIRKAKGDKGNQVFKVDKVKKDYGPCQATQAAGSPLSPSRPAP